MEKTSPTAPASALPPWNDEYKLMDTLEATQDELVDLIRQRESIEYQINKLQNDITHLAALCRVDVEDPIQQLGLTDVIQVRSWHGKESDGQLGDHRSAQ